MSRCESEGGKRIEKYGTWKVFYFYDTEEEEEEEEEDQILFPPSKKMRCSIVGEWVWICTSARVQVRKREVENALGLFSETVRYFERTSKEEEEEFNSLLSFSCCCCSPFTSQTEELNSWPLNLFFCFYIFPLFDGSNRLPHFLLDSSINH